MGKLLKNAYNMYYGILFTDTMSKKRGREIKEGETFSAVEERTEVCQEFHQFFGTPCNCVVIKRAKK